jgi:hypothetical protein
MLFYTDNQPTRLMMLMLMNHATAALAEALHLFRVERLELQSLVKENDFQNSTQKKLLDNVLAQFPNIDSDLRSEWGLVFGSMSGTSPFLNGEQRRLMEDGDLQQLYSDFHDRDELLFLPNELAELNQATSLDKTSAGASGVREGGGTAEFQEDRGAHTAGVDDADEGDRTDHEEKKTQTEVLTPSVRSPSEPSVIFLAHVVTG